LHEDVKCPPRDKHANLTTDTYSITCNNKFLGKQILVPWHDDDDDDNDFANRNIQNSLQCAACFISEPTGFCRSSYSTSITAV